MASAGTRKTGVRRSDFIKGGLIVGGTAAAGGLIAGAPAQPHAATRKSRRADARALELLLLVEQTEVAFYSEAVEGRQLEGEVREYARQVLGQEREHLAYIEKALGGDPGPAPKFDFGNAVEDQDAFAERAAQLEDLAVAAYNGQATNVSRAALAAAATVVSVEARHAAWIRSIVGEPPAPDATDAAKSAGAITAGLERIGLRQ